MQIFHGDRRDGGQPSIRVQTRSTGITGDFIDDLDKMNPVQNPHAVRSYANKIIQQTIRTWIMLHGLLVFNKLLLLDLIAPFLHRLSLDICQIFPIRILSGPLVTLQHLAFNLMIGLRHTTLFLI